MNVRTLNLPFRVGTTSYIIADDLLPNARFLAEFVQDMQLVLFDVPDGPSNLPDTETVRALAALGQERDLTYTVHLIEDVAPQQSPLPNTSLHKAHDVISRTALLTPWAYVFHLDGRAVRAPETPSALLTAWQRQISSSIDQVAQWAGDVTQLAVENLEGYPPAFVTPVIAPTAVNRCVDVGHLWLDGHDPLPWLQAALPRTRVVHLHGLHDGRDHQSIAHTPPALLDPVIDLLLTQAYSGVLTLEIFGEDDFWSSLQALQASIHRCCRHS
ncbi:MAG: sugar phosphate isomerase/epimerase [Caldilinea sp. CFX5]|nr:sugar phosphate isomerase/epimerase [Caldilinea sp. CFX5]